MVGMQNIQSAKEKLLTQWINMAQYEQMGLHINVY